MHGVNANDGLNFVRYKYKHMANRNNTHESIAAFAAQITELNTDLTARKELSVLDIDLLRKHMIDLYEEVNRLRLVMKEVKVKDKVEDKVEIEEARDKNPSPIAETDPEPVEAPTPEEVPVHEPVKEVPVHEPVKEVPVHEPVKEVPVPEPVKEVPVHEPVKEVPVHEPAEVPNAEETLQKAEAKVEADAIKSASNEEEANDLASKFSNTPINDLKKAISIVKKFEFINALFQGNVEKYAYSIHHMNNLQSGDDAFTYLHDLRTEYKWEDEDKNFLELANLVRRRYLG